MRHQHYGVECTVPTCGPNKPARHCIAWTAEEDAALLAADDVLGFAQTWGRSPYAAAQRRVLLKRLQRKAHTGT